METRNDFTMPVTVGRSGARSSKYWPADVAKAITDLKVGEVVVGIPILEGKTGEQHANVMKVVLKNYMKQNKYTVVYTAEDGVCVRLDKAAEVKAEDVPADAPVQDAPAELNAEGIAPELDADLPLEQAI